MACGNQDDFSQVNPESTRGDVAAECGVPEEWVPANYAELTNEEVVAEVEMARDQAVALQRLREHPLYQALFGEDEAGPEGHVLL